MHGVEFRCPSKYPWISNFKGRDPVGGPVMIPLKVKQPPFAKSHGKSQFSH